MTKSKLQLTFEANMLDGQDLEDCAGDTLSAWEVFQFIEELVADDIGAYRKWLLIHLPSTMSRKKLHKLYHNDDMFTQEMYVRELAISDYAEQVRKIIKETE